VNTKIWLGNLKKAYAWETCNRERTIYIHWCSVLQVPLCSVNRAAQNLSKPLLVTASSGVVC